MFKIFSKQNKRVYLDYAAASPNLMSLPVEYQESFENPSAIYKEGLKVNDIINKCRADILKNFDAVSQKIIFLNSATQSINVALQGSLESGDHLIISAVEHPAVLECAKFLEREKGVELTALPVNEFGLIDIKLLRENLKPNTKLVSIIYANNEIGTVQPIKEIGRSISEYNRENNTKILFHTDATQAINYLEVRMGSNRLDMISFNSSKIYAGKGSAALIYNKTLKLKPIIFGGGQENNLWSGTEDLGGILRLSLSIADINDTKSKNYRDKEALRLNILKSYFLKEIQKEIKEVILWTKAENSLPNIINIGLPDFDSDEMVIRLDEFGFAVSHKSACAATESSSGSYVLQAVGSTVKQSSENIRISMGRGTTKREVESLVKALKLIYYKFAKSEK